MEVIFSMIWYRDGNLLYTLKHAGWRKGKEVFQNSTTIKVEGDNAEEILVFLHRCLIGNEEDNNGRDDRSNKLIEGAIELATGESQEEFLRRVLKEGRY